MPTDEHVRAWTAAWYTAHVGEGPTASIDLPAFTEAARAAALPLAEALRQLAEPTAGRGSARPTDLRIRSRRYVVGAPERSSVSSCPNSAPSAFNRDVRPTSVRRGSVLRR
jgi:hypothetical protein